MAAGGPQARGPFLSLGRNMIQPSARILAGHASTRDLRTTTTLGVEMGDNKAPRLPPEAQRLADQVLPRLRDGVVRPTDPVLQQLTDWLGGDGLSGIVEQIVGPANHLHTATLQGLAEGLLSRDVASEGSKPRDVVAAFRSQLKLVLAGELLGEEEPFRVTIEVVGTDGARGVVGMQFRRFDRPVVWDGLFESRDHYVSWLGEQGLIGSLEQFERLDPTVVMKVWEGSL